MYDILIVEDDEEINRLLSEFLSKNGYETESLYTGSRAADFVKENAFDLILLDIMLPGKSGGSVLAEIRKFSTVPVIVISAKETTQSKIELLRLGADDYITKPFVLDEVLARVESSLRRSRIQNEAESCLKSSGLVLDLENKRALLQNEELLLTAKEFAILALLLKFPQKVFSKANLFQSVWHTEYICEDNTLNVHISNLRSKMKAVCPDREFIDTVWGIGYRLHGNEKSC